MSPFKFSGNVINEGPPNQILAQYQGGGERRNLYQNMLGPCCRRKVLISVHNDSPSYTNSVEAEVSNFEGLNKPSPALEYISIKLNI